MADVKVTLELVVDGEGPPAPMFAKIFEALRIPFVRKTKVVSLAPAEKTAQRST